MHKRVNGPDSIGNFLAEQGMFNPAGEIVNNAFAKTYPGVIEMIINATRIYVFYGNKEFCKVLCFYAYGEDDADSLVEVELVAFNHIMGLRRTGKEIINLSDNIFSDGINGFECIRIYTGKTLSQCPLFKAFTCPLGKVIRVLKHVALQKILMYMMKDRLFIYPGDGSTHLNKIFCMLAC